MLTSNDSLVALLNRARGLSFNYYTNYTNEDGWKFHTQYYMMVDINGDGYADLVDASNSENLYWSIRLNKGFPISSINEIKKLKPEDIFSKEIIWQIPDSEIYPLKAFKKTICNKSPLFEQTLIDINGDGLLDWVKMLVNGERSGNTIQFALNLGTKFSDEIYETNVPGSDFYKGYSLIPSSENCGSWSGFIDINGDSLLDFFHVYVPTDNIWETRYERSCYVA